MCSLKKRQGCWGSLQVSRDSVGFMKPALIEEMICRSICLLLSPLLTRRNMLSSSVSLEGQCLLTKKAFNIHSVQTVTRTALPRATGHTNKFALKVWNAYKLFLFSAAHWDKTRFIQLETWRTPVKLNCVLIFANILTPSFLLPSSPRCAAIDFIIWYTMLSKL